MQRSYNNGLVLVRAAGALSVLLGLYGIGFGVLLFALRIAGLEGQTIDALWQSALQSFVLGPLWLLCGGILMALSPRLARWIAKPCAPEAA